MARFLNLNPLSSSELNLKVKTASNRRYVNKHLEKCSAQQQIDHSENIASPAGVSRGARISSLPEEILGCEHAADVFPVVASLPPKVRENTTGESFSKGVMEYNVWCTLDNSYFSQLI